MLDKVDSVRLPSQTKKVLGINVQCIAEGRKDVTFDKQKTKIKKIKNQWHPKLYGDP